MPPNYNDNRVDLADVGSYLSKLSIDWHARNYGYAWLRDFVEASGRIGVDAEEHG